jgi:hypothetical protein
MVAMNTYSAAGTPSTVAPDTIKNAFMRWDSSRPSWRGPRPGRIASTETEHRRSLGTNWPEWSPPSAMVRGDCL